jgi:RNA polymerase sigma-70 factor, ECF subfamily
MANVPIASTASLPLPAAAPLSAAANDTRSAIEAEVVALFDQFRERLLRYLLTFGLAASDAEEVIQDVFLALFLHLRNGKPRDNLRGWLFRVAHNEALKRRRRVRALEDLAAGESIAEPSPNPEDQLMSTQKQQRLLAAFHALAERDRRCLWLRAEGLNYREIASVLDMSLGAVAISLTRSLARLARSVER